MSVLLVDLGNSRVKWAVLRGGRLGRMRAFAHGPGDDGAWAAFARALPRDATRARVVSVADGSTYRRFVRVFRSARGVQIERVRTTRAAAGVRCGYREPWRLGTDRWVALIGARHRAAVARDSLVVDVGTALTIDLVDRDGRHHGGAIVPGPALMQASLLRATGGIATRARASGSTRGRGRSTAHGLFARDTRGAIAKGAEEACAAVIDRAMSQATARLGRRPELLLTGGAAASTRARLRARSVLVPDLVLRGLAALERGV